MGVYVSERDTYRSVVSSSPLLYTYTRPLPQLHARLSSAEGQYKGLKGCIVAAEKDRAKHHEALKAKDNLIEQLSRDAAEVCVGPDNIIA